MTGKTEELAWGVRGPRIGEKKKWQLVGFVLKPRLMATFDRSLVSNPEEEGTSSVSDGCAGRVPAVFRKAGFLAAAPKSIADSCQAAINLPCRERPLYRVQTSFSSS